MAIFPPKAVIGFLLGALCMNSLHASPTYWLSDMAPTKEDARKMRPSHGGLVMRGKDGYIKKLWLRRGEDIRSAVYMPQSDAPLLLAVPGEKPTEMGFANKGFADVSFGMPLEGFYNLFMVDQRVEDGVLQVTVAKNESLSHNCRNGHDHARDVLPPYEYDGVPFDIIRERFSRENLHTHMTSGDEITYRVLLGGKPVGGATVSVVTQEGWRKTMSTDPEGRVTFEMIRDYYPFWHEFNKREMETFLVVAEYDSVDGGMHEGVPYEGVRYKATSAGNYYPSAKDYASYTYGLLIGLFGLAASIFFIYFHRKRRSSEYKEKRLA
jgi:hypothetical protein